MALTLDTGYRQWLQHFAGDPNGFKWHRRLLVAGGLEGVWIGVTPTHSVQVFNFAEAKCIINIPHIVRIQNKKRRRRRVYLDSQATQGSAKKSPSRQGTPGRATSPRKFDSKSPDKMKNKTNYRRITDESSKRNTKRKKEVKKTRRRRK